MFITNQAGDIDFLERNLAGELQGHHDHPGNPKEDNVEAGYEYICRMKFVEVFCVVWPSQGGERPQGRGEPGIEHVSVPAQHHAIVDFVFRTDVCLAVANVNVVVLVIPGWNTMPPPQLSTDAPILDIAHPGEIGVLPVLWHKLDIAILDCLYGRVSEGLDRHVPLVGEIGLYHDPTSVSAGYLKFVGLNLLYQS